MDIVSSSQMTGFIIFVLWAISIHVYFWFTGPFSPWEKKNRKRRK